MLAKIRNILIYKEMFMKFFDCYAHLGLVSSDPVERFRVVQEAKRADVKYIINVTANLQDFEKLYESGKIISQVLYAVGIAPSELTYLADNWEEQLSSFLSLKNVVALGAAGLDYSHTNSNKNQQIKVFVKQLDIANKKDKPAIIYNRNAGEDIKNILQESAPKSGVIFHCFSETAEYANKILDSLSVPCFFAFAGNVTFKNSRDLHKAILNIPLERILVESVSPFLAPSIFTGTSNVPANIFSTVEFISELLDKDFEVVAEQIYQNSLRAFGLSK